MSALGLGGLFLQIGGAASSAIGSYYSAAQQKINLKTQANLADINAKIAELGAQSALLQGQQQVGALTLNAGRLKRMTCRRCKANWRRTCRRCGAGSRWMSLEVAVLTTTPTVLHPPHEGFGGRLVWWARLGGGIGGLAPRAQRHDGGREHGNETNHAERPDGL